MKNKNNLLKWGVICLFALTIVLKIQMSLTNKSDAKMSAQKETTTISEKVEAENVAKKSNEDDSQNTSKSTSESETKEVGDTVEAANLADGYTIMGDSTVTLEQMVSYYKSSKHKYPSKGLGKGGASTIEDYCKMYLEESKKEGVRAEIPYVQSLKETGWLQFKGVCDISQYNFAGMGATGGDVAGESYKDVRTGIRAQIQHLKAYATKDALNEACVDTRYQLVKKASAPYVQWLGQQENPEGAGWAVDENYGISIAEMIQNLKTF